MTPVKTFPEGPNGRFAHIIDPEGRKRELWEPREGEGATSTAVRFSQSCPYNLVLRTRLYGHERKCQGLMFGDHAAAGLGMLTFRSTTL